MIEIGSNLKDLIESGFGAIVIISIFYFVYKE